MIEQPPVSNKYRLLVDDINETETFAITLDTSKVWYNRKIIGEQLSIRIEIHTALSDKGTTIVIPIGRYITIWQISKNETTQRIWFFDHANRLPLKDTFGQKYPNYFSDNVYSEYDKIQQAFKEEFTEDDDIVELVLVKE